MARHIKHRKNGYEFSVIRKKESRGTIGESGDKLITKRNLCVSSRSKEKAKRRQIQASQNDLKRQEKWYLSKIFGWKNI